MKNVLLTFLTIYSFSLLAQDKLNDFTFVEIDGPIKVELIQSDESKVEVLEESGLVEWEINGTSLVVMAKYRDGHDTPSIRIHAKTLKQLHAFGQVIIESQGTFVNRRMNIQLSSQSIAKLDIDAEELDVKLKEQSILTLSGAADLVDIKAAQQSIVNAKALKCAKVDVDAQQQSIIDVE